MFSFFKKKKKPQEEKNKLTNSQSNLSSAQNTQNNSSNYMPPNFPLQNYPIYSLPVRDSDEDQWIYDYIYQYLKSPLWKNPLYNYVDTNCIIFEDVEENPFIYTQKHNEFIKLVEELLEKLLIELKVTQEQFIKALEKGIQHHEHKKIFEQVLLVENFIVFKKLMIKRNKELELEALQSLERQQNLVAMDESTKTDLDRERRRLELEKNNADLDHAISISLAADSEIKRIMEREEAELQRALELSRLEADEFKRRNENKKDIEQISHPNEELNKPLAENSKIEKLDLENEKKIDQETPSHFTNPDRLNNIVSSPKSNANPLEKQKKQDILSDENKKSGENTMFERHLPSFEEKKTSDLPPLKKPETRSDLPPIKMQKKIEPELDALLKGKDKIRDELEAIRNEELQKSNKSKESDVESMMERKKRLTAQRELLLKKKQAERELEVNNYNEGKASGIREPLQSVFLNFSNRNHPS